ncbi:MAG: GTPase ObgE [Deltaproteobacteria bacterium]|nr:GTPase ObgE [Deltaproteobacteria bacterium]
MQFIDEAEIHVKAGDGGAGAVAFRREKFIPRGGPSGGDGGNGSDVVLETDERLSTLLDFRFKREYKAKNGEPGRGRDQNGHAAPELVLKVPPGTLVKDASTGQVIADLRDNGTRYLLAKGGRGGLGNMNFATPTLQAPRFAQPGTEGEEKIVRLELRLLADVGLVGFPNAGKSTLVSRLSRARPKIADYPFTTLQPHLGVVQYKDQRSFVLTDLPGLIEGAHAGAGLGHRFLKHMQRCRAIIHLVDASSAPIAGRDLVADFDAINNELMLFDRALARKPQVIAANKVDVGPEAREAAEAFKAALEKRGLVVHLLSGATGEGLEAILDASVLALDRAQTAGPLDRDVVAIEGALTEDDLEESEPEAHLETVPEQAPAIEPLAEDDLDEELPIDERELASQEKQSRRPALTGRRKDGIFKEVAAQTSQVRGKKFTPTSDSAAKLMAKANRAREKAISRALAKDKKRPQTAAREAGKKRAIEPEALLAERKAAKAASVKVKTPKAASPAKSAGKAAAKAPKAAVKTGAKKAVKPAKAKLARPTTTSEKLPTAKARKKTKRG